MMPITVGTDRYFRSTETLDGFPREIADAVNGIAQRLRNIERATKRVSAIVDAPSPPLVALGLPTATSTLRVGGSGEGGGDPFPIDPPGRIAEFPKWVDILPTPVVCDVRALVKEVVDDIDGLLDEGDSVAPQSRVSSILGKLLQILRVLAPFVPAASVAENLAEKFLSDGRTVSPWVSDILERAIAGIKDGTLNMDDAVAVLSTITDYAKGRG